MNAEFEYLVMKNRAEDLRKVAEAERRARAVQPKRPSLLARLLSF
ncbi:hypothetical protein [Nonomuraea typhae]|uniref:Uncharacterized protein n=1 Tax=Nonomuraea typhae TaxID=2603600 RepID=A0ABW7Z1Q6_9ACTN